MAPPAASKDDASAGKKRRAGSGGGAVAMDTASVTSPLSKISKKDLYADLTRLEEEQSQNRSPEEDAELFSATCSDIRQTLKDMLDLKVKKGAKASASDLSDLRIQATLSVLTLKKLNRLDKLRTRTCRDATAAGKQKVDALHLKLQNLLYEVLHLQKEVTKCQQFKSKDEEIEMIDIEEFYR
jgi:THO complex subunit 5